MDNTMKNLGRAAGIHTGLAVPAYDSDRGKNTAIAVAPGSEELAQISIDEDTTIMVGPNSEFTCIADAFEYIMKQPIGTSGTQAAYGGGLRSPRWILQLEPGDIELVPEIYAPSRVAVMTAGIWIKGDPTSKSNIVNSYEPGSGDLMFVSCSEVRLDSDISAIKVNVTFKLSFALINMDDNAWIETLEIARNSYVEINGSTIRTNGLLVAQGSLLDCYPTLSIDNTAPEAGKPDPYGIVSITNYSTLHFYQDFNFTNLEYYCAVSSRAQIHVIGNVTFGNMAASPNVGSASGLSPECIWSVEGTVTNTSGHPTAPFPVNQIQRLGGYFADGTAGLTLAT